MRSAEATAPNQLAAPRPPHAERLAALRDLRDYLGTEPPEVLSLLTEVATHRAARYEIAAAVRTLDGAAAEVARYRPAGVPALAAFMPSNVLLYSYVLYLLVPSLFVDRLRFRAASQVADQALRLHELLAPRHGLPIGPVVASQREYLRDVTGVDDVVVFTGSYQNAEKIRRELAPHQLFLFLGSGVNPFVVTEDADVARAVRDAVDIRLLNAGQDCLAPDLFFVHERRLDEFVAGVTRHLTSLRYGPYTEPDADYGPIFYEGALEAAALYLYRHRSSIVHGGGVDFRLRRLEPALLVSPFTNRPDFAEFFTPVFNVVPYPDVDALAAALATGPFAERALGASIYGPAPELARALARRHTVTTDTTLLALDDGNRPFGGYGPMANYVSLGPAAPRARPILVSELVAEHLGAERG